jgi:hypothetical protein
MALPNSAFDQVSAITEKYFVKKAVDNIFDSDPLLKRSKSKGWYKKIDGGTQIVVPLNYALNNAGGWYSGSQTLNTTDADNITAATYDWRQLYETISVSRIDELKNSGVAQVVDLVKAKTQIAEKTMLDRMGDGLYSAGTDSQAISGLRVIVDSANTVGGISQSTYSWWQSQEDSSTTTLTLAALQTQFNALCINNEQPTVGMATRANYNRLWALLQPQQRFVDAETAKAGFSSLMFNGVPVIAGAKVPANHLFWLNENYLYLWAHKDEDMVFKPFESPINQNVKVAKLFWAGALGTDNCRMHGKLSALAA